MQKWFESNQSGIETKTQDIERGMLTLFESNQSGIETDFDVCVHCSTFHGLNRTKVELKRSCRSAIRLNGTPGLNRTKVELKPCAVSSLGLANIGLNRTKVELKHSCC